MPMTHKRLLRAAQRIKTGRKKKAAGKREANKKKGQPLSQDGWPSLFFVASLPSANPQTRLPDLCALQAEEKSLCASRRGTRPAQRPTAPILNRRNAAANGEHRRMPAGNQHSHSTFPALLKHIQAANQCGNHRKTQRENRERGEKLPNPIELK